jgi:hypothetical protein
MTLFAKKPMGKIALLLTEWGVLMFEQLRALA